MADINGKLPTLIGLINNYTLKIKEALADAVAWISANKDSTCFHKRAVAHGIIFGTGGLTPVAASGDFTTADLGQYTNIYLHIKLPFNKNTNSGFFGIDIVGYNYGNIELIDAKFYGFIEVGNSVIHGKKVSGSHFPEAYFDINGNLVIRLFFSLMYYTNLRMDSNIIANSPLISRNNITNKVSLSSTVSF